jgi:hypothetical protein
MWKRLPLAALLMALAVNCPRAQAQGVLTNSSSGGAEKPLPGNGRMDQIEQDIFGAHKRVNLDLPSLPGQKRRKLPPPFDPNAREKIDAQKNWMFSDMNELNSPHRPEDILGLSDLGPDGVMKPKLSAMERFYNGLGDRQQASSNQLADVLSMVWTVKQLSGTNSMNPMVFAFPTGDRSMLKTLMTMPDSDHSDGATAGADDFSDVSDAMIAAQSAAAADRDKKRHEDTFRQLLGLPPSTPTGAPSLFSPGGSSYSPLGTGVYNPAYSPETAPLTPSSLSPVPGASAPPVASTSYHPYNVGLAAPVSPGGTSYVNDRDLYSQPANTIQTAPLDPFTQNFPKRKF